MNIHYTHPQTGSELHDIVALEDMLYQLLEQEAEYGEGIPEITGKMLNDYVEANGYIKV